MSIHKSKGLEFPVVFLSSTSKKINLQDLKDDILLHQNIGLGPDYINYDRRIRYSTAAKAAIKLKIKEESISEEMRVLYVALTRAREKLIITGTSKNYYKDIEKKKENLSVYDKNVEKINPLLLKKYISYLDWFELVSLKSAKFNDFVETEIINQKQIIKDDFVEEENNKEIADFREYNDYEFIKNQFNWNYANFDKTKLPIKTSVSTIKELKSGVKFNDDIGLASIKPEFLENDFEKLSSKERGTLVHLVLQKIDLKKVYTKNELVEFVDSLVSKNIITNVQRQNINVLKIYNFLNSDLAEKIRNSIEINREQPFCTKLSAKNIFDTVEDEEILVQGIIDLYFIDSNGDVFLVDYKTDYVKDDDLDELKDKYYIQLEIYKKALEKALNKDVKVCYIYSIYLNKAVEVSFDSNSEYCFL